MESHKQSIDKCVFFSHGKIIDAFLGEFPAVELMTPG
jgi:hypothetical protein